LVRHLAQSGKRLCRRQEILAEALESGERLKARIAAGARIFVVDHGWLTAQHPDPTGACLRELVEILGHLRAPDDDLVFVDFCSLYQIDMIHPDILGQPNWRDHIGNNHPALRTEKQEKAFVKAIRGLSILYVSAFSKVIIMPAIYDLRGIDPRHQINTTPYAQRFWCRYGFSLSVAFQTVANRDITPDVRYLMDTMDLTIDPAKVEQIIDRSKLKLVNSADKGYVFELYHKYFTILGQQR